jgi:hypothetical protein
MTSTLPLPYPWDRTIAGLIEEPHQVKVLTMPSEAEKQLLGLWLQSQEIALHWLVKFEWLPKHKVPGGRSLTLDLKPEGVMLHALYRLCVETHALVGDQSEYTHAAQWFWCCFCERIQRGCWEVQYSDNDTKDGTLATLRSFQNIAKDYQNPFEGIPGMEAHSDLLRLSAGLAERFEGFYFRAYQPFLRAWSAVHTAKKSPRFARYFVDEGKLCRQSGRGKSKTRVKKG